MPVGVSPPPTRLSNSWCTCPAGAPVPVSGPVKPEPITTGRHVESAMSRLKPDTLESVTVKFYKAIEEPFQAEAVVPAD
jgi:hypothetical protein